jgi:hypothetical protein
MPKEKTGMNDFAVPAFVRLMRQSVKNSRHAAAPADATR